jgi:hypothetical protein
MVMIAGFAALTVDVGVLYNGASDTQRTVGSAALAGAGILPSGDSPAKAEAAAYVADNPVLKTLLASGKVKIQVGRWIGQTKTFTPGFDGDGKIRNAVRVVGTHDQSLFFAKALGFQTADVTREAVAVSGGGVCAGVWGMEGVTLDGNVLIDSYDSRDGSYGPGNIQAHGDVCSCQDVWINGGITVNGDLMYGDGYNVYTEGSSFSVMGSIDDHSCGPVPAGGDFVTASWDNDNATIGLTPRGRDPFNGTQWDFYLTAQEVLTLNPGKYYFTSAMMDGQSQLIINGPVEIYVDGPANFAGGGLVNASQDPKDLIIYASGETVHATGGSGFYGAIHAPNATVFLDGGSTYYGTILGKSIDSDGSVIVHVDEAIVQQLYGLEVTPPVLVR